MKFDDETIRVLVVDDDEEDRNYIAAKIRSWGYDTREAYDGVIALETVPLFDPHVIVSDLRMPRIDGFELVKKLREQPVVPPVIMLTQTRDIHTALAAMHEAGVFWFIEKPVPLEALQILIQRASAHRRLQEENARLRGVLQADGIGEMVGKSPQMQLVFATIRQAAPSKATVLITGESGTGKELVARAIHASSPRRDAAFVALNCAALPESLIESELFGHERGAFTGAAERRLGRIELAHGGTLFLDEIGELAPQMQAKLLRVLEDSQVQRLGGKSAVQVDVRVLAATNRPPLKAIKEGKMREDLYYRLNVFNIVLSPLRERKEDLPQLVSALLSALQHKHDLPVRSVDVEVMTRFQRYSWPGNVRELRNVLERAVILAQEGVILPSHLPHGLGMDPGKPAPEPTDQPGRLVLNLGTSLYEAEKALILSTLEFTQNNRRKTAEILGLSLKTIQIKLKQYFPSQSEETQPEEVYSGS